MRRLVVKQQQPSDGEERRRNGDVEGKPETMHLLPCKIRPDKVAADSQTLTGPVDRYFRPYAKDATTTVGDTALWHASLRGKPLTGVTLAMPDDYVGVLCSGTGDQVDQTDSSDLIADEVTEQLMYWNWDRVPSREDPLLAALDWVRVSEAIMINDDWPTVLLLLFFFLHIF